MNMSAQRCHRRCNIHNAKRQAYRYKSSTAACLSLFYLSFEFVVRVAWLFLARLASRRSAECVPNAMYRSVSWATTSPSLLASARECEPFPSRLAHNADTHQLNGHSHRIENEFLHQFACFGCALSVVFNSQRWAIKAGRTVARSTAKLFATECGRGKS